MKKEQILSTIMLLLLALIIPLKVEAKEENKKEYNDIYSSLPTQNIIKNEAVESTAISSGEAYISHMKGTDGWLDDYDKPQSCTGKDAILGSYNDEDSVAWLLQKVFNYIKIIGPRIVVVMSGVDFAKVIVTGDDEGLKKAQSKLIIRLLLAGSLFVLPDLVSSLLEVFNITSSGICGLQ